MAQSTTAASILKPLGEGGALAALFVIGYVTTAAIIASRLDAPVALAPAALLYIFGATGQRYGWFNRRWLVFSSALIAAGLGVGFALTV